MFFFYINHFIFCYNYKMRKIYWEIVISVLSVLLATFIVYARLAPQTLFWNAQSIWSILLIVGWVIVALGYYHQGWMVHKSKSSKNVSTVLPVAVFVVQCVLFVKGIYYSDRSLIIGALLVNSGVVFSVYQILKMRYSKW